MIEDNFARVAVVDIESVAISDGDDPNWIAQDIASEKGDIQAKIESAQFKLKQLESEASEYPLSPNHSAQEENC